MNNPLKKIFFTLILVVILPVLLYTISEFSNINSDEDLIEEIYKNQLESVIYSVNQYSQDYINNWVLSVNSISLRAVNNPGQLTTGITDFMKENASIKKLFFSDNSFNNNYLFDNDSSNYTSVRNSPYVRNLLLENKEKVTRLFSYEKSGYNKTEPINNSRVSSNVFIVFINEYRFNDLLLCGIELDATAFVAQVLAPKMQEITREDIIISCYDKNNQKIFSNLPLEVENFQKEGNLWLLPDYRIAISLKGRTLEGLIKQRSITNSVIIGLITLSLIGAGLFLYKSISKEVKLAQIKSDFVSNVSHELRTPLALISMFAETLELNRVKSEEKKQEYYKIISQETGRLSRIVNTILNFSKMEAGKREYKFEKSNLNEVIRNVLTNYHFHLKNNGFQLNSNLYEGDLLVNADKEAVSEAFINILDNAVKYSTDKKVIEVVTGLENNHAFFSVKDFGLGIAEKDKQKIFEKFFRVSSGLVHNTKGTGMGLSIVKHIIDAHKGEILIESRIGAGSLFKILIPLQG